MSRAILCDGCKKELDESYDSIWSAKRPCDRENTVDFCSACWGLMMDVLRKAKQDPSPVEA